MKVKTNIISFLMILIMFSTGVNAQTSVHSSWGEGTGQGWSLTYSVGQLFTTQVDVVPFLLKFSEGVQQPFEVIRIGGTSSDSMRVYPIPSDADITLQITGQTSRWTGYRLLDYRGRLLTTGMITGEFTSISLIPYSSSAYMLEVDGDSQPTQVFRVIKR